MEMTETLPKKRIAYIDVAKGIGILLMILGHTMTSGWGKDVIYSFHMPLFFIIGGYLYKEKSVSLSLKNHFRRLVIPYVFAFRIFKNARNALCICNLNRGMMIFVS